MQDVHRVRIPIGIRPTADCVELLTLVGDLLAAPGVDAVGRATRLLQCLACDGPFQNRRCDACRHGIASTLDVGSAAFGSLLLVAPDISPAMRAYATDPIVSLLAVARRDRPDLFQHSIDVARVAGAIATRLGTIDGVRKAIVAAAMFHDLGELLRRASAGADAHGDLTQALLVASGIASPVARAAAQHHEHIDGSGRPNGLSGEQIGIGGRILAVSEAIVAVAGLRGERIDTSLVPLVDELLDGAGSRYDRTVAVIAAAMLSGGDLTAALAMAAPGGDATSSTYR